MLKIKNIIYQESKTYLSLFYLHILKSITQ